MKIQELINLRYFSLYIRVFYVPSPLDKLGPHHGLDDRSLLFVQQETFILTDLYQHFVVQTDLLSQQNVWTLLHDVVDDLL